VGYWLQVGANIGILMGLVLVGLQMQQNSSLVELQIMQQSADSYANVLMSQAGEEFPSVWEKHMIEPENLTIGEYRVIDLHYWNAIQRWRNKHLLFEKGLLDESEWQADVQGNAAALFNNRFGRAYWENLENKSDWMPTELEAFINESIANGRGAESGYQGVMRRLGAQ
jgi:hypothetical protein